MEGELCPQFPRFSIGAYRPRFESMQFQVTPELFVKVEVLWGWDAEPKVDSHGLLGFAYATVVAGGLFDTEIKFA